VLTDGPESGLGAPVHPDEPVVVLFTSGTTARPKGVIHSLNTLLAASRNFAASARLRAEDSMYVLSPLASVTGVVQAITVAPLVGCTAVLDTWDAATTADLVLETAPTFFGGPDVLLDRLLDELGRRGAVTTTVRSVFVGGTMLDERILRRVEDAGIVVMRAYGSSEAPVSTTSGRDESRGQRLADDGAPLDGVEVRAGSRNDPGECCIRGPHVFLGYVDDEDDAGAFDDSEGTWYCTGDVADLSGGRVRVVGRIRDIVIRNGQKVPISEVEAYLQRLPGVVRAAGFAVEDDATRERLAMSVMDEEGGKIDLAQVGAALRDAGLATWKVPEELIMWDEPCPENATGKIVRDEVRRRSEGRPRVVAPRLETAT
jgi:acyl-CoA synthetase (AMP-forming)/AMP-acid ligase II